MNDSRSFPPEDHNWPQGRIKFFGLEQHPVLQKVTPLKSTYGLITNIQRLTFHDGPGIRTEFFLKGCPLSCKWCSNPEGQDPRPEPGVYPEKCLTIEKCGVCIKACQQNALLVAENSRVLAVDRKKCANCGSCANACFTGALKLWGKKYSVSDVMDILLRDKAYYDKSGGGITFSGGEALLQPEFIREVFIRCKNEGIHTCVESALHVPRNAVNTVLDYTEMFITDIKTMDDLAHREYCGVGIELIQSNMKWIAETGIPLIVRIPVIQGINSSIENLTATGHFILQELKNKPVQVQLLPFRRLGTEKYSSLNADYPFENYREPPREEWEKNVLELCSLLEGMGIPACAGANKKL